MSKRNFNQVVGEFYTGKTIFIYYSLTDGEIQFSLYQPFEGAYFPAKIMHWSIDSTKQVINVGFMYKEVVIGETRKGISHINIPFHKEIEFIY